MSIYDIPVHTLADEPSSLAAFEGSTVLIVNVASKCGLTPQYEGLEALQKRFGGSTFSVVGFPSNQFAGQEPGTAEEIQTFCSTTYGVTFPLFEKIDAELTTSSDAEGYTGDIRWNFEKFLVGPDGTVQRFGPQVVPEDPAIVEAIEALVG
jgi:glutathione peroxidase